MDWHTNLIAILHLYGKVLTCIDEWVATDCTNDVIWTSQDKLQHLLWSLLLFWVYLELKGKTNVLGLTHISNLPKVCVKLTRVGGWVGLALWRQDLSHEISIFAKILFNFVWEKNVSLNKCKPSENPFNIAKNEEFELISLTSF